MRSSDAIALIKQRINIVELINRFVPLKQVGSRFVAPCPFHEETKPSFSVNPDGYFYCFGCQKHGDIFDFWMEYHGVTFREALNQLAEMANVTVDETDRNPGAARRAKEQRSRREQLLHMYRLAQAHFQKNLFSAKGGACRAYMKSRGITEELLERFGLGWAMDDWHDLANHLKQMGCDLKLAAEGGLIGISSRTGQAYDPFRARLMFPIRDTSGTTIAFGGRIIDNTKDAPKYVNTTDSPIYKKGEHLYGPDRPYGAQKPCTSRKAIWTCSPCTSSASPTPWAALARRLRISRSSVFWGTRRQSCSSTMATTPGERQLSPPPQNFCHAAPHAGSSSSPRERI